MKKPPRAARSAPPPAPIWISVDDAVPYLGVSRETVYRAAKAGTLQGIRSRRIGRRVLLSYADVMSFAA